MDSYANGLNYTNGGVATTGIFAAIAAVLGVIVLISLVVAIFQIIGQWKMFKKADQPGWAAIIPIYNTYILCKVTGVNPWWIVITMVGSMVGSLIPGIGSLISFAITIYFVILLAVSTANSYGKENSWAIGLILLEPFFMFALGVGQSKYEGPKPMNDVVLNKAKELFGSKK